MNGGKGGRHTLPPYFIMSAIKDGRVEVEIGGGTRKMLFSLNVLDEMQDKFGGYDKLAEALQGKDVFKNVKWLLTRLINEGADDEETPIDENWVGKKVHAGNLQEIISSIYASFNLGTVGVPDPEPPDETLDEDDPEETIDPDDELKNEIGVQAE